MGAEIGTARLVSRDVQRLGRASVDVAGPLLWTAGKTTDLLRLVASVSSMVGHLSESKLRMLARHVNDAQDVSLYYGL